MENQRQPLAIVVGVGPGLGLALVRKFLREGCRVGMVARSEGYLRQLEKEFNVDSLRVVAAAADAGAPKELEGAIASIRRQFGPVDILVHHASASAWKGILDLRPQELEEAWRVTVLGAFVAARAVVADMLETGRGALLFTGATSGIRGRKNAVDFSSAKFGLRGMVDAIARELWPKGIHVAHVVVDGMIETPVVRRGQGIGPNEPLLQPDEIAESYWALIQQKRSSWTFELDVRPYNEEFFT